MTKCNIPQEGHMDKVGGIYLQNMTALWKG